MKWFHQGASAWSNCRLLALGSALGALLPLAAQASFVDPLDSPAVMVSQVDQRPLQALARAGQKFVAVGARGLVITSDDEGETWLQSPSPVQSDLVAVTFPREREGWAVGHDGVVLHSSDSGMTWQKQLDGRLAKDTFVRHYQTRIEAGDAASQLALESVERNYAEGASLPLLDVWFEDSLRGYAVGAFGTLIATRDGGRTWEPWLERIDNDELLNLNGVQGIGGDIYIAAERGTLFKLDRAAERFKKIETGYDGSFFGLTGTAQEILLYGLRGTVYRSADHGASWTRLTNSSQSTITAGRFLPDMPGFVLVNAAGELLLGNTVQDSLVVHRAGRPARFTGVMPLAGGRVLLSSLEGVRIESLNDLTARR